MSKVVSNPRSKSKAGSPKLRRQKLMRNYIVSGDSSDDSLALNTANNSGDIKMSELKLKYEQSTALKLGINEDLQDEGSKSGEEKPQSENLSEQPSGDLSKTFSAISGEQDENLERLAQEQKEKEEKVNEIQNVFAKFRAIS